MPREKIELPYQIERLSILDADGNIDESLEPDLGEDLLLEFHRAMLLSRRLDERMLDLQRQGRIGTFAPVKGQEASQIGSAAALKKSDWLVQSYRDQAAGIYRGQSIEGYLLVYAGYYQGGEASDGAHILPVSVPVGTQTLHAAGLAYAIKYRGEDAVALVYFGDGATSEGDFYEAMNFAGVFQVPVVFVCQNNQYAISMAREHQTKAKTLAQKSLACGVPGIQVDGNDVLAVHTATSEAVARARAGDGPTLVECETYRLSLHTTADDPTRYRSEEEVEKWEKRDPIPRFQKYLKDKEVLNQDQIDALEDEIKDQIQAAVENVESRMAELEDQSESMFEHIYAEMPDYLRQQREEFMSLTKTKEKA